MNCSYRSLWNEASGTFVAVSENAASHGKRVCAGKSATGRGVRFALQGLSLFVALAFAASAQALPAGGVVAAGVASINAGASSTTINQTSQNAVINWQSFNIAAGQSVQFVQPNRSAVVLNRVLGADPSRILGSLSANGQVFLVNPSGVLFGRGSSVNVGGLLASTLNITNHDFLAGNYLFSGAGTGAVLNQGTITANAGFVALLGANVNNEGVIAAQLGSVALAAGASMKLDLAGDGLLNVTVSEGAINALVQNGGLIQADGGNVLLTAMAAGTLLQSAVNNTGVIQAQSIENHNGTIKLMGDMQIGTVNVGGKLDASAPNGGDGGFIETSAAHVNVADSAIITTQSVQGKTGTWLIDPVDFTIGTAAGDNITPAALAVLLASNVTIHTTAAAPNTATDLYGVTAGLGDITVKNDVAWGAATTLTLDAVHNVNLNANITATTGSLVLKAGTDIIANAMPGTGVTMTTNGGNMTWTAGNDIWVKAGVVGGITATGSAANKANITWTAGRDIKIDSAVTTTDANFTACCGRDIVITAPMTMTRGTGTLKAGNDGSGLGVAGVGGTVVFSGLGHYTVTGPTTDVGVYYTPASYAAPHDYSGNFTLSVGATLATMTPHMLVFAKGNDKVYDGSTTATLSLNDTPVPSLGGAGTTVTLDPGVGAAADFDSVNAAANIGITYSNYVLGGVDAAKFSLWAACLPGPARTRATITAAPLQLLTVTASDATKTYGQTAALSAWTSVGLVGGETIGAVTLTSPGTPATAPVNSYAITPSDARGGTFVPGNYIISYVNGVLKVIPAALTVTANNVTKPYGQTIALPVTAFTTAGLVNGDTVTSVTETSPGTVATASVAGSAYPIMPSGAIGAFVPSNYTVAYVNGVLTVTPAPLTVTANDAAKTYGQVTVLPTTAFTTIGLVNGDIVTSVTEVSPGTVASAPVAGSPYAITPSGAVGTFVPGNYTVAYVNGVLTVTPANLIVTANNASKTFGQTTVLPTTAFTTVGLVNGDTVTSVTEVSPGTVASAPVAGSPFVITPGAAAGSFVPGNYTVAYVNGVLTVTPANLTVTANNASKTVGQTTVLPTTAFTTGGLVNGDTVTSVTEVSPGTVATASVSGNPYAITPSDATGTYVPGNYSVAYVNGVLTVIPVIVQRVVEPPVAVPPLNVPPVDEPLDVVPPVVIGPPLVPPVIAPPPIVIPPVVVPPSADIPLPTILPEVVPPVLITTPSPPSSYRIPVRPRKQDRN